MAAKEQGEGKGGAEPGALSEYMDAFSEFVSTSCALEAKSASDPDTADIISANAEILNGQVKSLSDFIRSQYRLLSEGQQADVDNAVVVMNGVQTAKIATGLATKKFSLAKSWKNLLSWLTNHLHELKKIILALVNFIFDLLGKKVPEWVASLALIIDEIFDFVATLLGGEKGEDRAKLASEFSAGEVSFWNEMAAAANYSAVRRHDGRSGSDD